MPKSGLKKAVADVHRPVQIMMPKSRTSPFGIPAVWTCLKDPRLLSVYFGIVQPCNSALVADLAGSEFVDEIYLDLVHAMKSPVKFTLWRRSVTKAC